MKNFAASVDSLTAEPLSLRWENKTDETGSELEHILLLTLHHIIFDGWSVGVLLKELGGLYEAFSAVKPSTFPELPIQYADFAYWQRQHLQKEVLESQLGYWKRQLGGNLPVLELPTDRARSPVQTFGGAKQSLLLPKSLTESLKVLSQREGVTLFMTLLAAFKILLYRYTGQEDMVVGAPIAGRDRTETEKLIGVFINTLVLRTDAASDRLPLTYGGLLAQIDQVICQLNDIGVGRQDRVAIALSNSPEMAVAFLAIASGATCAPLNPAYRTQEFDFYLSELNYHSRYSFRNQL